MAASRPLVTVWAADGQEAAGQAPQPAVFTAPIRPDIVSLEHHPQVLICTASAASLEHAEPLKMPGQRPSTAGRAAAATSGARHVCLLTWGFASCTA